MPLREAVRVCGQCPPRVQPTGQHSSLRQNQALVKWELMDLDPEGLACG